MRYIIILCLLVPTLPIAAATHTPDLVVSELYPTPETDREFIELLNPGNAAIQLQGYTIQDNTETNVFTFPEWSLGAGERVVVWGGGVGDAFGPAWSRSSVWNSAGDTAWVRNAAGDVVAWAWYGGSTSAPAGHSEEPRPAAPTAGTSLHFEDSWMEGAPSPGFAADGNGGQASGTVEELPPEATLTGPESARAGAAIAVSIAVSDKNGNLRDWEVTAGETVLGQGTASDTLTVTVPQMSGTWTLQLTATDEADNAVVDTVDILVRLSDLQIQSTLDFGLMQPGQTNVLASGVLSITNVGTETLTPKIDISPLRGAGEIPVNGNLLLTVNGQAVTYSGALTSLGELAPDATLEITMAINTVPVPLAAGVYSTSFGVVA